VRSYVPDVDELRAELQHEGVSATALSQVIFD
jgi:hypothetical protein